LGAILQNAPFSRHEIGVLLIAWIRPELFTLQ
jgi:hypothetical protein